MFDRVSLDHVVLRARDADALISFYCTVLGAKVERSLDIGLVQLRLGSILIDIVGAHSALGRRQGPPPDGGRNLDHFCLRVEPFDEAAIRAHLEACDVAASATQEVYGAEGFGPSIYVTDPEGTVIELKGAATRPGRAGGG
ncbi:MAG: VOC family protein [Gammaproteobacteria bacterium]|jgi:glyoxylase I family protein